MVLQQHKIVFGGSIGAGKSAAIKTLSDIPVIETEAKLIQILIDTVNTPLRLESIMAK